MRSLVDVYAYLLISSRWLVWCQRDCYFEDVSIKLFPRIKSASNGTACLGSAEPRFLSGAVLQWHHHHQHSPHVQPQHHPCIPRAPWVRTGTAAASVYYNWRGNCGTRALLEYLDLHPDVETSEREVQFFDNDSNYGRGIEWYRSTKPRSRANQYTMEKSPRYVIDHRVPGRVKSLNTSIKLLVILRNPTTRQVSDYLQSHYKRVKRNKTHVDFETFVQDPLTREINVQSKAVQVSIYHQFFSRWFFVFPRNQIHVEDGKNSISTL